MSRRVVVTGMAGLCPLGQDWKTIGAALRGGRSGVTCLDDLAAIDGVGTRLAAPISDFEVPTHYPRKKTRSMGRVALLATRATELALRDANLLGNPLLGDGSTGIAYGSTSGSPPAMEVYAEKLFRGNTSRGIRATDYVQFMSHTVAANLAQFFGVRGRVIPACSACTSGSQGIGFGFETVRSELHDVMICGGAEEYHPIDSVVFDVMFATSTRNDTPHETPRPFDAKRDGLVVGEGAGTLVLEGLDHARRRGVPIHAEVIGFGTNCDGSHITNPCADGMGRVMEIALASAAIRPGDVGYINAHATATEAGDIAESLATHRVFGERVPVSSLKGCMGHTLGACGALEAWITIEMMREGWFAPTANLDQVDGRCAPLDYIQLAPRRLDIDLAVSNNFAFGGVNTSLVLRRWTED